MHQFTIYWILLGLIICPIQLIVKVPYGKHVSKAWGGLMPNKPGWILMEGVALLTFLSTIMLYKISNHYAVFFAGLYIMHYLYRTIIFPIKTRTKNKQIPIGIVASGVLFNSVNAFLNGYFLSVFAQYGSDYAQTPSFIIGLLMFIGGFALHLWADHVLIHLRKPGETGYKTPEGGLYKWISCPNYLGEIIEWSGFFILCQNLAALSFLVWTISNLLPRAIANHKWYLTHLPDYPPKRKALIPYIL